MTPDGVNLVDENNARRGLLPLLKHVAYARGADAYEHFNKIRAADGKERNIRFACNRARQQRLAGAGRADHQDAFGNAATEFLKFFRVAQKLDELLHFVLCFLNTGDIAERNFIFVAGEHASLRFAEIKRALSGHADLLAKQEVKHEQKQGYWQKANQRLRQHVGFRLDGRLNADVGKLFLQIICEIQIDRGSKWHRLRRRRAHTLTDVSAAQGLRRPAILYHQLERIIFVVNDLFVFQ